MPLPQNHHQHHPKKNWKEKEKKNRTTKIPSNTTKTIIMHKNQHKITIIKTIKKNNHPKNTYPKPSGSCFFFHWRSPWWPVTGSVRSCTWATATRRYRRPPVAASHANWPGWLCLVWWWWFVGLMVVWKWCFFRWFFACVYTDCAMDLCAFSNGDWMNFPVCVPAKKPLERCLLHVRTWKILFAGLSFSATVERILSWWKVAVRCCNGLTGIWRGFKAPLPQWFALRVWGVRGSKGPSGVC